jgi:hypothetical protein
MNQRSKTQIASTPSRSAYSYDSNCFDRQCEGRESARSASSDSRYSEYARRYDGCETIEELPFVLMTSIMRRWRAGIVNLPLILKKLGIAGCWNGIAAFIAITLFASGAYAAGSGSETACYQKMARLSVMRDASQVVPQIMQVISEPFDPIQVGIDNDDTIAFKLSDIECRAEAIEALRDIGEIAAISSGVLIDWALTVRVVAPPGPSLVWDRLFVDLITIDVLERMRVAGAIAEFGPAAVSFIVSALKSPDGERRKLAVTILNEKALIVSAVLLKSRNCDDRELGRAILWDMWPVVSRSHLSDLKNISICDAVSRP